MVKLLTSGQADKAQQKLKTLLALQNEPIMIAGALISNYLDLYRVLLGRRSRRGLGDVAKDFGYKGNWNYRLNSTEKLRCASSVPSWRTACTFCKDWTPT